MSPVPDMVLHGIDMCGIVDPARSLMEGGWFLSHSDRGYKKGVAAGLLNDLRWCPLELHRKCHRLEILFRVVKENSLLQIPCYLHIPVYFVTRQSDNGILFYISEYVRKYYGDSFFPRERL